MFCLKCGRETSDAQVFCDTCLQMMEQFPVKPDAAVHLPHRPLPLPEKKQTARKRAQSPEEQVIQLRKLVRRLSLVLAILTLVLGMAAAMLLETHFDNPVTPPVGRNYTINTPRNP